eukprot:COSAG02_NODE_16705_length_1062_cov_1.445483_1_plen_82_part_00
MMIMSVERCTYSLDTLYEFCDIAGVTLGVKLLNSTELVVEAPEGEVVAPGDLWVVPGKGLPRAPSWYGFSNCSRTAMLHLP